MAKRSQAVWLAVCCTAALVIILAQTLGRRPSTQPPPPPPLASADAGACDVPGEIAVRPNTSADAPPALLVAEPPAKLYLDGQPTYSTADAPRHIAPGEHELRAESPGESPLVTRVRVDPFTPFLVHAQTLPGVGVTLVRHGVVCVSCDSPLNDVELAFQRQSVRPAGLLAAAGEALRRDEWTQAAHALRGVPLKERRQVAFLRLAAAVHAASLQPDLSRRELETIAPSQAAQLPGLLKALDGLREAEGVRRHQVLLDRWNKLTERFGAVTLKFQPDAPGAVSSGTSRFDSLSKAFEVAVAAKKVSEEDELVSAAETTLSTLVAQIRKARPRDCSFQAEVVATALR